MKTKLRINIIIVLTVVAFYLPGFSQDNSILKKNMVSVMPVNQMTTGYVQDTGTDPFIVTGDGKELGDPMPVYWDGVWHLYVLSVDFKTVPHFTSTDLVNWVEHKPAMVGHDIATGTVLRNENKYYLFYTDGALQNIHLVVSDNPWEFDFSKSKLVAEPDDKIYKKGWFRDAYVFYNEQEKLWWMLFEGRCPEVCTGLLKSKDLLEWSQCEPIFKDGTRVYGSCPQIFQQGKLWYLACQDWYNWYYTANTPYGPWKNRGQYISVAIEAASRFATDGKRQITWGWLANFEQLKDVPAPADVYPPTMKLLNYGGPLCVGREMVFKKDGTMGVRPFPELLTAICSTKNEIELAYVRKLSGVWKIEESSRTLKCNSTTGGLVLFDIPAKNPNYYFESKLEFGSSSTTVTIIVRSSESADKGYGFTLDPASKKIAIRGFNYNSDYKILNDKEYDFPGKSKVNLQIFIFENNMEAFVDGQECLSARTTDKLCYNVAIDVKGGPVTICKPFLHCFRNSKGE